MLEFRPQEYRTPLGLRVQVQVQVPEGGGLLRPLGTMVSNPHIHCRSSEQRLFRSRRQRTNTISMSRESVWWYLLKCEYNVIGVLENFCLCQANLSCIVCPVSPTYCLPHRRQVKTYTTPCVRQCRPVSIGCLVWFWVEARNIGQLSRRHTRQRRLPQERSLDRRVIGGRSLARSCLRCGLLNFCGINSAAFSGCSERCRVTLKTSPLV